MNRRGALTHGRVDGNGKASGVLFLTPRSGRVVNQGRAGKRAILSKIHPNSRVRDARVALRRIGRRRPEKLRELAVGGCYGRRARRRSSPTISLCARGRRWRISVRVYYARLMRFPIQKVQHTCASGRTGGLGREQASRNSRGLIFDYYKFPSLRYTLD